MERKRERKKEGKTERKTEGKRKKRRTRERKKERTRRIAMPLFLIGSLALFCTFGGLFTYGFPRCFSLPSVWPRLAMLVSLGVVWLCF
jgi:heme/copper-type cytochrome/quinol oxidase subunit 3